MKVSGRQGCILDYVKRPKVDMATVIEGMDKVFDFIRGLSINYTTLWDLCGS